VHITADKAAPSKSFKKFARHRVRTSLNATSPRAIVVLTKTRLGVAADGRESLRRICCRFSPETARAVLELMNQRRTGFFMSRARKNFPLANAQLIAARCWVNQKITQLAKNFPGPRRA